MKARVGRFPVVAALILVPASMFVDIRSTRAEDACLTAPNGPAPQGSHWYFHEDRATQQKCWTIKPVNHAAGEAAAPDKTAAEKSETDPVTATPSGAHPADPARNTQANARRPAKASAARTDVPPAGGSKVATRPEASPPAPAVAAPWPEPPAAAKPSGDAAAWPNPQAKTAADPVAWPDPSAASVAKESIAWPDLPAAQAGGAGAGADKAPEPSTPAAAAPTSGDANAQLAGAPAAAASSDLPVGLLLGGAVMLVIVGLYLRAIVTRSIKRPRTANIRRREPAQIDRDTDERRMPAFPEHLFQLAANQNEQLRQDLREDDLRQDGLRQDDLHQDEQRQNDEAVAALRKLLLILDRRAA